MLYEDINKALKQAMLARDIKTADVLRVIKSRISEYLVQQRLPRDIVPDDVVLNVLSSYKKSLLKAIEQLSFDKEKAKTLIEDYTAEIKLCEQYLPNKSQVVEQLDQIIAQAIIDLGANNVKQVGQVIGYVMKNNSGLDGKLVKDLVLKKLGS